MKEDFKIYIAYDSNRSDPSGEGWIKGFCDSLKHSAGELDFILPEIEPAENFAPEKAVAGKAYLLIVVLSKGNHKSSGLKKHIEVFNNLLSLEDTGVRAGLFKVMRFPLVYHDQPKHLRDLEAFEFFSWEAYAQTAGFSELAMNNETEQYWMQVSSLVHSIHQFVTYREEDKKMRPAVYLSNCSRDLTFYRQIIKRELESQGYEVLPNKTYPDDPELTKELIAAEIKTSLLSIHLVGLNPEEPLYQPFTLSDIQYNYASKNAFPGFRKLIWTLPEVEFADDRQKMFFETIRKDSEANENSYLLQSTLEELKSTIKYLLAKKQHSDHVKEADEEDMEEPVVYLLYDASDSHAAHTLAGLFRQEGYRLLTPVFDLDYKKVLDVHKNNMDRFDVAIIFCENCGRKWLKTKIMELMKSPGYGRKKPLRLNVLALQNATEIISSIKGFKFNVRYIKSREFAYQTTELIDGAGILQIVDVC